MRLRVVAIFSAVLAIAAASILPSSADVAGFGPSVPLLCRRISDTSNCGQNIEPDVKFDAAGNGYASAIVGVPGGTNFWRRPAGETIFRHAGMPEYDPRLPRHSVVLGGGDTALATATAPNSAGFYNVYVASLYAAGVTLATSRDAGLTWELNYLAGPITADRQWIAADGAETVWLVYKDFSRGALAVVSRSDDGGTTFGLPAPVYDLDNQQRGTVFSSRWSPLTIDPASKRLYWSFATVETMEEAVTGAIPQNPLGVSRHVLRVAVSDDGGLSWTNHTIWTDAAANRVDAVFPWVAVDAAGDAYAVWSTTRAVYLSRSSDGGSAWSAPVQVSSSPVGATVLPTIIGGRAGTVDVAFLGTTAPSLDDETALWDVYFAQSQDGGATFTQVKASDQPVHKGSVCLRGLACDLPAPAGQPGNRAMAEVVTISVDADGMAIIATPFDYRKGSVQGTHNSLLIKQMSGPRAIDSTVPVIPVDPEPR